MNEEGILLITKRTENNDDVVKAILKIGVPIKDNVMYETERNKISYSKLSNILELQKWPENEFRPEYRLVVFNELVPDVNFSLNLKIAEYEMCIIPPEIKNARDIARFIANHILGYIKRVNIKCSKNKLKDMSLIKSRLQSKQDNLRWTPICSHSYFALWHRPSVDDFKTKFGNCTHIVSLLGSNENPEEILKLTAIHEIEWIHIPLSGSGKKILETDDAKNILIHKAKLVKDIILEASYENPVFILIHCAAGLHRTGTFAYMLLRLLGFDDVTSQMYIHLSRRDTAFQVGMNRINYAEKIVLLETQRVSRAHDF